MRATAGTTAQRLSGQGVHVRLREDQPLSALLEDPTDDSPVIAHIAAGDGESEACLWVEDALRRAGVDINAAFVYRGAWLTAQARRKAPACAALR
jgi:hypothetical protein